MESPVLELERILKNEINIYEKIASIEEEKTDAILSRDGTEIELFAAKQEQLLDEIAVLEKKRTESIEKYRQDHHYDDVNPSLRDVIRIMDEDSALCLMRCGMELKKTMLRIQSLSETNSRLIEDNMEFFNILLSGLKNSSSVGYTRDGSTSHLGKGSYLFNKTV
jgi:flagellar biosynthesis/type III secretory pathway chaperone